MFVLVLVEKQKLCPLAFLILYLSFKPQWAGRRIPGTVTQCGRGCLRETEDDAEAGCCRHRAVSQPSPGRNFSGCNSAVHKDSTCVFSSGAAENRSHQRAEAERVSLLSIVLSIIVVIHYKTAFLSAIRVLFTTSCFSFVVSKKAAHVCWQ